jgi:hypothetical protein
VPGGKRERHEICFGVQAVRQECVGDDGRHEGRCEFHALLGGDVVLERLRTEDGVQVLRGYTYPELNRCIGVGVCNEEDVREQDRMLGVVRFPAKGLFLGRVQRYGRAQAALEGRPPRLGVFCLAMRNGLSNMGRTAHRTHSPSTRRTSWNVPIFMPSVTYAMVDFRGQEKERVDAPFVALRPLRSTSSALTQERPFEQSSCVSGCRVELSKASSKVMPVPVPVWYLQSPTDVTERLDRRTHFLFEGWVLE